MKIKWRFAAFRELRSLPEVQADLHDRAVRIAAAAGSGMDVNDAEVPRHRARSSVVTATPAAMRRSAKDNALSRALDAGR